MSSRPTLVSPSPAQPSPAARSAAPVVAPTSRSLTIATPFGPYELPRLKQPDSLRALAADRATPKPGPPRQILIVDEDPISCARLAAILRESGHRVIAADSPRAAERLGTTVANDLCIASLGPRPTDLLAWLTQVTRHEAIPIVTISRRSQDEALLASAFPSATAHLTLPVRRRALITLVAQLLER